MWSSDLALVDFSVRAVTFLWLICTAFTTIGCVYALFAAACLRRLSTHAPPAARSPCPSVSILKPLYGAEPRLLENLASFAHQNYGGFFEVLFGVHEPSDPAVNSVNELMEGHQEASLKLVVNPALHGPNRKVSNLVNLAKVARGDVIVLADSDMRVGHEYLSSVVGSLYQPGVGLVTCLYRGLPVAGPWSRLSAMAIDYHFMPSVLVGLRLSLARPCFGSTIALRRHTLDRIGGFEAFADCLADDYAVGAAVRSLGYNLAIPPIVLDHTCFEATFSELLAHELRWARTIRRVDPLGFAGSAVTHPVPLALLVLLLVPDSIGVGLLVASLACRLLVQIQADRVLGGGARRFWWGPLRDILSFAVFLASFWPGGVSWRGHRYVVRRDGTLA